MVAASNGLGSRFSGPAALVLGVVWMAGCSASDEPSYRTPTTGSGGMGGITSGDSTGATPGAGGSGGSTGPIKVMPGNTDAGLDPDAACSGEVREGERVPLDMYFLLDQSGSMSNQVQGGTKWKVVSDSLVGFLNDPANADIGVGIGYFPLQVPPTCMKGDPWCFCIPIINVCIPTMGGSCNVLDYAKPSVPLALPPNHGAVAMDIGKHSPGGGTPTRPALEGAIQYVSSWAMTNSGRKTVVVLATDGDPEGCSQNSPQDIANLAARALNGPPHLQTFVIGVGSSLTSLNLIAEAGGTTMAYLVDTGGSVGAGFTAALNQIRGHATPCAFSIPMQTSRGAVDPSRVNVYLTPKGATQRMPLPMTQGGLAASCGATGGWYYDDPSAPKTVRLCDASCQALQGGRVELEFGCKTIIAVPK